MADASPTRRRARQGSFSEHLDQAIGGLRDALAELMASVGAEPDAPLRLGRLLGVNKNLSWKATRIVASEDGASAVPHLPGTAGFDILLRAFEQAGADPEALREAAEARREFERMLELHAGDRGTLERMVGSSFPGGTDDPMQEASRKQAFLGNTSTWGVQAKVRFGAQFAAPGALDPERLDVASVGGMLDFRRLRPSARWPLWFDDYARPAAPGVRGPIDPRASDLGGPAFLLDHCTRPLPEIRGVEVAQGIVYELCPGPVGKTASFSCAFGRYVRSLEPILGSEDDPALDFVIPLNTPVELATMDVFLHRDLYVGQTPEVVIHSRMELGRGFPSLPDEPFVLPIPSELRDLGAGPPGTANPSVPQYRKLLRRVCERMDWRLEEFRGYRFFLRYPPIPTDPLVRVHKPVRPRGAGG